MRQLGANALTEIAKHLGTEPISILAVSWSGTPIYYSDKELPDIAGKILELSGVDSILSKTTAQTSEISVTLDDTDGIIKGIIDSNDIHKRQCILYQYFGDLDIDDKFQIFRGQLSSPFTWSEGDRTVSFSILSEIENKEIGFSPEEGQFDFVSDDAVGKPWPLCFGQVIHVPAAKIRQATTGQLQQEICEADITAVNKTDRLKAAYQAEELIRQYYKAVAEGAELIAPPVRSILSDYLVVIQLEDRLMIQLTIMLGVMDRLKRELDGSGPPRRDVIKFLEIPRAQRDIIILSATLNDMRVLKDILERNTQLAQLENAVKQEAFEKQQEAVDNMRAIEAAYNNILTESCLSDQCSSRVVPVTNGSRFPQNTPMEVLVKGTRYRVSFSGDVMTILAGPLPKYQSVPVTSASAEACSNSSLNAFTVPEGYDVADTWALVTVRNDTRKHVIKISKQDGQRCLFDLVQFATNDGGSGRDSGGGGGLITHDSGGDFPIYRTPFGPVGPDLAASGLRPQDAYNLCNAITPEVLAQLGAVSTALLDPEEFQTITTLQCLLESDEMSNDLLFMPDDTTERARSIYTVIGEDINKLVEVSQTPLKHWFSDNPDILAEEIPSNAAWKAEVGSAVVEWGARFCEIYVANILPSTIKAVSAYRTINNQRHLALVPSTYYTKNESESMGPITVTSLRFHTPLMNLNAGWEDDIYVTLDSSVGPNVVDILQWLIETYTDRTVDTVSFDSVRGHFRNGSDEELYPANFALLERRNVFDEINDIAWQARCALIESNGVFYIKYLSEEPTPTIEISEDDIELNSFNMNITETENLITRMDAIWQPNYLPLEDGKTANKVILRHNVLKYGLITKEFNFYIYNIQELVIKSATFWLIRMANTWKNITFTTFLHKSELETLDEFTLAMTNNPVANTDVTCSIEKAIYNTDSNTITISAWVPVRIGEMDQYLFAWPANVDETEQFPTALEIELGYAGGPGNTVSANISGC